MLLVLALLAAAPAPPERFVLSVGGVPAGVVSAEQHGGAFRYESVQLFARGARRQSRGFAIDGEGRTARGRVPEVWWLLRKRAVGCVDAVEELTGRDEVVCVDSVAGDTVRGRVDDAAFTARYDPSGRLAQLSTAGAQFERSDAPVAYVDPFERGFPVVGRGSAVALEPRAPGSTVLPTPPEGVDAVPEDDATCLELARRAQRTAPGSTVVLGVVVEGELALPHAWIKLASGRHVDPSLLKGEGRGRVAIAFEAAQAGRLYLSLRSGAHRVVRREP